MKQHSLSEPAEVVPVAAESVLVAVVVAAEADPAAGAVAAESVLVAGVAVEADPVAGVAVETVPAAAGVAADLAVVVAAAAPAVVPIEELQSRKIYHKVSVLKADIALAIDLTFTLIEL